VSNRHYHGLRHMVRSSCILEEAPQGNPATEESCLLPVMVEPTPVDSSSATPAEARPRCRTPQTPRCPLLSPRHLCLPRARPPPASRRPSMNPSGRRPRRPAGRSLSYATTLPSCARPAQSPRRLFGNCAAGRTTFRQVREATWLQMQCHARCAFMHRTPRNHYVRTSLTQWDARWPLTPALLPPTWDCSHLPSPCRKAPPTDQQLICRASRRSLIAFLHLRWTLSTRAGSCFLYRTASVSAPSIRRPLSRPSAAPVRLA
jgi:hypothetical protein